MKVYKVLRRREADGRDKPFWDETGWKIFQRDDGRLSMLDQRTGEWYSVFEQEARDDQREAPKAKPAAEPQKDFDDDIPF